MRNRKIQLFILLTLVSLVGTMSIAYAVLSTTLNINGTAQVQDASWNVHFDNVQVNPYSVEINPVITDNNKVSFSADLTTPGDFYKFTVDIVNEGSIDAMIESIIKTPELTYNQKKYLRYEVEYIDGTSISDTQLLKAGETKTISILFSYRNDIPASELPTTETNLDLEIVLVYIQADSTGTEIYGYNLTYVGIDNISGYPSHTKANESIQIKFNNSFTNIKIKSGDNYLSEDSYTFDGTNLKINSVKDDITIINVDNIQVIPDFSFSNEVYTITMGGWNTYRYNYADGVQLELNGTYDISNMKYVEFDLYIPSGYEPTQLTGIESQLEIGSGGTCDVNEGNYNLMNGALYQQMSAGTWNHIVIPFTQINFKSNNTDLTSINYLGLYWCNTRVTNTYSIPNCKIKNYKFSNYIL